MKNNITKSLVVWGISDLYFIFSVMIALFFAILSPNIQSQLHLSSPQLGMLGSIFFLSYGLAQLPGGFFLDRLGPRITLSVSAIIAGIGVTLLSTAYSFEQAMCAQCLIGIGLSTAYVGVIYLVGKWFPSSKFALMSGISQMSSNFTVGIVVIVMSLLGAIISFRVITGVFSVIIFAVAIALFLIVRNKQDSKINSKDDAGLSVIKAFKTLSVIPQFWLGVIYFASGFGIMLAFADLWNIQTQLAYNHSIETAAMMNAMFPIGGAIGALTSGWIADRINKRALVAKFYITGMVVFSLIFVYVSVPTFLAVIIMLVLGYFFGGAVLGFSLVGQHIPESLQGTGFGFMAMAAYILSAIMQSLVGVLLSHTDTMSLTKLGMYKFSLSALVGVILIGWLASFWLKDK